MMQKNAWAIGFYSYSNQNPDAKRFEDFYRLIMSIFDDLEVKPTYFAVEGDGYNGVPSKFGSRVQNKVIKSGFSGIQVMSLVANPEGSDEPNYDSFASASLGYAEGLGETLLCLAIEERFCEFAGVKFEQVLHSLALLQSWDYGFALSQSIEKRPELHVLGLDSGKLESEERRRLNSWYASLPDERIHKVRDVYPYVILNKSQLEARVSASETLQEMIQNEVHSSLTSMEGSSLWTWKIKPDAVASVREKLAGSGILIA